MTTPWDLNALLVDGEIDSDVVAARERLDIAARDRAFEYSLLHDFEMMLEIAKAASKAAEKEERRIAARAAKAHAAALGD